VFPAAPARSSSPNPTRKTAGPATQGPDPRRDADRMFCSLHGIRFLLICTANICRSPTAAGLLALRARSARAPIEILSFGLLPGGREAPPQVVEAVATFGVDLSRHRSAQLSIEELSKADVAVTMTRQHLRELVIELPDIWPRVFTLPELVRRGEIVGPRLTTQSIPQWIECVHQGRRKEDMIGAFPADDVIDPYGGPDAGYRRMAATLSNLVDRLSVLVWPDPPAVGLAR